MIDLALGFIFGLLFGFGVGNAHGHRAERDEWVRNFTVGVSRSHRD